MSGNRRWDGDFEWEDEPRRRRRRPATDAAPGPSRPPEIESPPPRRSAGGLFDQDVDPGLPRGGDPFAHPDPARASEAPEPGEPAPRRRRVRRDREPAAAADADAEARASADQPGTESERIARSTAFFAVATGLSRVAGLVREIVAAAQFGVLGVMSAFTVAFQVPNLVRSLFADAAIQAAFVPVFTELLEKGDRREAFRLASTLIYLVAAILGVLTAVFILAAPLVMPLFGPGFNDGLTVLMVALSQLLFPILVLLGLTGMVAGILNSYDRFNAFAISPFFWNVAIIVVLLALEPMFEGRDKIYAYAIGVLVGTVVQLAINAVDLRNTPFRLERVFDWRSPTVRRVLLLMLPVTISLGLINFNLAINSIFGTLVSAQAPAAIDKAFRVYMLPQGIFSVAISTVLFPTLARFAARKDFGELRATMANGMRQITLLLVPAAAVLLALSEPITAIIYERGAFDGSQTDLVATALFWFAFSLPFNGLFLLMTRTFFSLQRPWIPTAISLLNLLVTAIAAFLLYRPYGIAGIVAATALATAASVAAQAYVLRGMLGRLELGALVSSGARVILASAALALVALGVYDGLTALLGAGFLASVVAMVFALAIGGAVYIVGVRILRVPEAAQIVRLLRRRSA
ncbi:murein biosynthesis integral membrane protein MurJ [Thermoleophilia bacterium SCSIO 60948]|nr:murein biosynthesis integral membrane protein MurJ [Thermoleophilia bacterium SCSIO 60948]